LLVGSAVLYAVAWWKTEQDLQRVFVIEDPPLGELAAASAPDHGRHLYLTRGCADCHGDDGRGGPLFEAGPVIRVTVPNITPAGLGDRYDVDSLAAAIRHGVRHDGRPLIFMPSTDWEQLSDVDTAALAAHVLAMPALEHAVEPIEIRPLARVLHLFGQFPLLPALAIDHAPRARQAPAVAANARYGFYLAQVCTGCHGVDFSGLKVGPADAPRASDLRRGATMAGWTEADFVRAMREGKRPDDSDIDPFMPWENLGRMTDVELGALWKYMETLPPAK
jgi:mono/diheme cytochrome c family protein